ncbi:MAG: peptidylprolyl isomerase [Bacteroidota bacterium]
MRIYALWCAAAVFTACGFAACGMERTSYASPATEAPGFMVGKPLQDSTLAAVVIGPAGSDTLLAQQYLGNVRYLTQQFPQVMLDAEQSSPILREIVLRFVNGYAAERAAERAGIEVAEERVDQVMDSYQMPYGSAEAFRADLAARGETYETFRDAVRQRVVLDSLYATVADTVSAPSPEAIAAFRLDRRELRNAQHILFMVPAGATVEEDAAARAKAEAVFDSLDAGADFTELASRLSEEPGAERTAGNLGFFSKGQMVEPFETAVYALADSGDVAPEPVRTQFGYHVIRYLGQRADPSMTLARAGQELAAERRRAAEVDALEQWQSGLTVRLNPSLVNVDL